MEFRVLGPVEVLDGDARIDFEGAKPLAVVAALLAGRGESISQDRLAEAFWPDSAKSRDTLQSYVSRVRKKLGPTGKELLVRDRAGYSLESAGLTDIDRFESVLASARAAQDAGDPETAARSLRNALGEWRGAAFGEFATDELVQAEAARLEEERLSARELLIEVELVLGHHREVITEIEDLCAANPLRERPWELRMLALVRAGRQADALRAYQQAREVLVEELGIEPGERLRRMEQMVLDQDPSLDLPAQPVLTVAPPADQAPVPPVALPPDTTAFVGREHEIEETRGLLETTRLLTLTGIGGVGKTRLAIAVARRAEPDYPGGVGFVDLSGVTDPSEVGTEIASSVASRVGETLIIIDNCEHLIDSCADAVSRVLTEVPLARILATSREPLRVPGEIRRRVEPMSVPDTDASVAELLENDASRLFVERARATRPDIDLDDAAMADVAKICRRLDGIPLAIELAAALVGSMGLRQIEEGLTARFELLREGYRTAPARQQTLGGAFDWSYSLLDDSEKRLLRQLRPLQAGFPRRAAEVICADDPGEEASIGAGLGRLVDRSLVQMEDWAGHATFSLLPTIKEFVWERTGWQGELEARAFVVALAQHTEPRLRGSVQDMWSALFDGPADVARDSLDLTYHLHDLEAGSLLAGVVAASMTSSGRVAFVGGVRSNFISRFEAGFRAGIEHAGREVRLDVEYLSEPPDFSGFMDIGLGRTAATSTYRRGADIIFHAAGFLGGQGVFEGARAWHETSGERRWVIGVDLDEGVTRDASVQPFVLTSMRRQIPTTAYVEIKAAVSEGAGTEAPPLDLSNEGVGMSLTGGRIDHLMDDLARVSEAIIGGDIEVPRVAADDGDWWAGP